MTRGRWLLASVVGLGLAIRIVLLPTPGFVGDIDAFVGWVGDISEGGLGNAFDNEISFGPVMVYIWWLIGLLDPATVSAIDSSDAGVRIVMKLPAVIADFVLAGAVWYGLRGHRRWALPAVALVLLHPAIWFVSAWWGQYDSVYVAAGALAFVLAIRGRDVLAVVALAVALMTKPQAAPLVVPFAAWYLARAGWGKQIGRTLGGPVARIAGLAGVGILAVAVLWLPFLPAGGPWAYLDGLARYQSENFALLSVNSWNLWWPVQELLAPGAFVIDGSPLVGGLSYRAAGYLLTGVFLLCVGYGVARRPTPRTLAVGLVAGTLVAYSFLTTMHERYAFAALPVLAFLLDDPRMRALGAVFGTVILANMVAATERLLGVIVPLHGPLGMVMSLVVVACTVLLVTELVRGARRPEPPSVINEVSDAGMPPGTSASSAVATS